MLTLSKPIQKQEKVKIVKDNLINEIKCLEHYRLSQNLTEDVCNAVEFKIKKKYKVDKKELVLEIFQASHSLTSDEKKVIETQIDYLVSKKILKKFPLYKRLLDKAFFLLGITTGNLSLR